MRPTSDNLHCGNVDTDHRAGPQTKIRLTSYGMLGVSTGSETRLTDKEEKDSSKD